MFIFQPSHACNSVTHHVDEYPAAMVHGKTASSQGQHRGKKWDIQGVQVYPIASY